MKLNKASGFFLLAVILFSCFAQGLTYAKDEFFTPAENEWLRQHPILRAGVDPAWGPVEFIKDGVYEGMGADYMHLLEGCLGIKMQVTPGLTWPEVLEKAKNKELDVLPFPAKTPDREAYLNFTQVLVSLPTVIITRADRNNIKSFDDLSARKVSVAKAYAVHEWLKENYPRITLVPYSDVEQSLEAVAFGEVDAYVGDLASATHSINRLGLVNLKVAGNTPYTFLLCMGIRKDWPELVPILNKAISAISEREREAIRDKWIVLRSRIGMRQILIVVVPMIIVTVLLTLLGVNWRLRREISERKLAQEELKKAHDGLEDEVRRRTAELAQTNDELRKSEEKYRELVEGANSIIMRMDVGGNVTFFNEFAQKFFGYKEEQILGRNVIGTIVPLTDTSGRDLKAMLEDIMINSGRYTNNENENILANGQRVWIAWTNKAVLGKDNCLKEILCIGNDISKLKLAEAEIIKAKEAAESANKAKSSFLANMSHELRTPLNAIIGFSELMKDGSVGEPNEKQKEYLGYVWESGKHLLSLINDILDLSKVEAGKMELERSEFDLKELLKKSLIFISEKAMKHGVGLTTDIKEDVGAINADERKIKQVVFNLLSNAVKFTPDGGKIGIDAKKINDNEILVCVWDTGIGIEVKDGAKVFAEFEQIDSEYSRKYTGTGLGMPLSKKFIELHGGRLWLESAGKGKGSRFYFTLPVKAAGVKI